MSKHTQSLPTNTVDQSDEDIDFLAVMLTLLRGWKVILLLAILGLMIGMLYTRYVNPTYQANALIQIEENSQGISALGTNISQLVAPVVSQAQTEAELIKSRMVLNPVIDLLHLDIQLSDPSVGHLDRLQKDHTYTQLNTREGVSLETDNGQVQISDFIVPQAYLNHPFTLIRTKTGFTLSDDISRYQGQFDQPNTFKTTAGDIQLTVTELPTSQHPIKITKQTQQNASDIINGALTVKEMGYEAPTGIIQLSLIGSNQEQISLILKKLRCHTSIKINHVVLKKPPRRSSLWKLKFLCLSKNLRPLRRDIINSVKSRAPLMWVKKRNYWSLRIIKLMPSSTI